MARPLWSGSLGFGIVSIPVRMFSAVRDRDIHFNQISRRQRKRIRYRKVVEGSSAEVPASDIVKGYAVESGRYVIFTAAELEALAARRSRVIDIERFVALEKIDPLYFEHPYHLLPGEGGAKPYQLLVRVLRQSQRVGIARLILRSKEHLVAVRSIAGALAVQTLRYADEVIDPERIDGPLPRASLSEREQAMAGQLVDAMAGEFDPSNYQDEFRARLRKAIARKAQGGTIAVAAAEEDADEGKVLDLMAALKRSLAERGGRAGERQRRRAG